MKPFPVPVVALGPGSQADEDADLDYLPLPRGMDVFNPPRLPDAPSPAARAAALRTLEALVDAMAAWPFGAQGHPVIEIAGLAADARALVNDALGQGEVSARVAGSPSLRIQESAFAGVWRVHEVDAGGRRVSDRIETCAFPPELLARTSRAARPALVAPGAPAGAMNAPAVLAELLEAAARYRPGEAAHVVNLTLLPTTPVDLAWLAEVLGAGPAVILSRGYGNCRITSTALAHTWWVQYFNSGDTLILNTIEVAAIPDVALAAADDFADSIARLREWLDALASA